MRFGADRPEPETIGGRVGPRLRISFARTDRSAGAEAVAVPDLGWSAPPAAGRSHSSSFGSGPPHEVASQTDASVVS